MMVVVALAFIVSWTPFYVITFISQVQPKSFLKDSNFLFTMLLIHWFGFLHSCINPIIYNFMNEKFHRNFKQILHRCWIQRHSFRKNSTLLFGSSSRSSKSNSLENSPCTRGRQRPTTMSAGLRTSQDSGEGSTGHFKSPWPSGTRGSWVHCQWQILVFFQTKKKTGFHMKFNILKTFI